MNIIKIFFKKPLKRPKYIDDGYDWEEGFLDEKEEQLYNGVLELWPIGKVTLEEKKL
jgi:hypothetical protein